ncbi:MAG: hypothetical protein V2A77_03290 [Pseudomonadota bacterium]
MSEETPPRLFRYGPARRWGFLALAVGNVFLAAAALRLEPLGEGLRWLLYVLCANILLGPLLVQYIRLAREMEITVSADSVSGRNFFGRRVELCWDDVAELIRVTMPLRGATMVIVPRGGQEPITFAESIRHLDELLALIEERGGVSLSQRRC